ATTILTTSQQATVTASVGAQAPATPAPPTTSPPAGGGGSNSGGGSTTTPPASSGQASGSVTVTISTAPTILITPPTTPPSAGLPASFTFVVTAAASNGSAVREVTVDWGDGARGTLGAFTGSQAASHVFDSPGTFTVRATVTDAAGGTNSATTFVTVIPVSP